MNNYMNAARVPYIKVDSPEVKGVVDFAERFRTSLEVLCKS
jgi:Holliday junction resolvase